MMFNKLFGKKEVKETKEVNEYENQMQLLKSLMNNTINETMDFSKLHNEEITLGYKLA